MKKYISIKAKRREQYNKLINQLKEKYLETKIVPELDYNKALIMIAKDCDIEIEQAEKLITRSILMGELEEVRKLELGLNITDELDTKINKNKKEVDDDFKEVGI